MHDKIKVIPKGCLFTVTAGEYSYYCTMTVCKALKEIDTKIMQDEYLNEHPRQKEEYSMGKSQVIAWMVNEKGYAEEVDYFELHLGSYSNVDFDLSH